MKKLFQLNWNGIIPEFLKEYFELLPENSQLYPDVVLLWNEVLPLHENIAREARRMGIPVIVIQHGAQVYRTEYEEHGKKPKADFILAWSETAKQKYVRSGAEENKIIVTGSPLTRFLKENHSDHKTVVFAPCHLEPEEDVNAINRCEADRIWKKMRAMKGISPIVKLLKGEHLVMEFEGKKEITDRHSGEDHLIKTINLLAEAACVVIQDEGTFSTLAARMGIPVIKVKNDYRKWTSMAVEADEKDLEFMILAYLFDADENRNERIDIATRYMEDFDKETFLNAINQAIEKKEVCYEQSA